ncbi:hypothetical protein Tsp_04056, partial [Trichinella spiralis]|uniref:hypothetical protein n=1 Tax=Trichinella spiralis TaxID=6334 RepID=UPI0001EFD0DD
MANDNFLDNEQMISLFMEICAVEPNVARNYLENSAWDLTLAVHTFMNDREDGLEYRIKEFVGESIEQSNSMSATAVEEKYLFAFQLFQKEKSNHLNFQFQPAVELVQQHVFVGFVAFSSFATDYLEIHLPILQ